MAIQLLRIGDQKTIEKCYWTTCRLRLSFHKTNEIVNEIMIWSHENWFSFMFTPHCQSRWIFVQILGNVIAQARFVQISFTRTICGVSVSNIRTTTQSFGWSSDHQSITSMIEKYRNASAYSHCHQRTMTTVEKRQQQYNSRHYPSIKANFVTSRRILLSYDIQPYLVMCHATAECYENVLKWQSNRNRNSNSFFCSTFCFCGGFICN